MTRYDFILAGGGLAGLSLAMHLTRSPLRDGSILVVDRQAKQRNDRTWCFWSRQPTLFDEIVYHEWDRLHFAGEAFESDVQLRDYRYRMIRSGDLYRFARDELGRLPNVEFLQGNVEAIVDEPTGATVIVAGQPLEGRWVFDSRFALGAFHPQRTGSHDLRQHFKGWLIESATGVFDSGCATLMDFRTPQKGELRFFYVLPLSERLALVEFVALSPDRYGEVLRDYLHGVLGIAGYRIVASEGGANPLTDYQFARRAGRHVLNIGTPGGRLKPTSGYAFMRIQRDSAAVIASLRTAGHPFDLPVDSAFYGLCDRLLLDIMQRHGEQAATLFTALFKNNPIERVLHFLDESAAPLENAQLIASLPPLLFLEALFRRQVLRNHPIRAYRS